MSLNLTTDYLYKKSNNTQIKIHVDELIKAINYIILEKHRSGCSEISYELPEMFAIPNMERCDAQLIIYSKLIEHYEEGGFTVKLKLNPDPEGSFINIKWFSNLDPKEKRRMEKLISKHAI